MYKTVAIIASSILLITGCGPGGEAEAPSESTAAPSVSRQEAPDDAFDRALDDLTRAFFFHAPEAATRYGVSELVVPRTAHRLMNRSIDGEIGRREEVGAALDRLMAMDPGQLSGNRPRVHAVVTR